MADKLEIEEDEDAAAEWDWSPDDDVTSMSSDISEGAGLFINDVDPEAAANYTPIVPNHVSDDDRKAPKVYFIKPRPGTEAESAVSIPKAQRHRFWRYRHELYEQMEYILDRFSRTELGRNWLTQQRWFFHTLHFADGMPLPRTAMDIRHMARTTALRHQERIASLSPSQANDIYAWQEDITRCTLRMLGDSPTHVIRIASFLLAGDHTAIDADLYQNAIEKAVGFCPTEDKRDAGFNWAADALKVYSV